MWASLVRFIKDYRYFFAVYAIFLLAGGYLLLAYTKPNRFFIINNFYSTRADTFFKWFTYLGDGLVFTVLILALALYNYRQAVMGAVVFLLSSLLAQLLKHVVFSNAMRPVGYFDTATQEKIHFVTGVTRHAYHSFPSGHTTTAFALALFVAWVFKWQKLSGLLAILAVLVGYSRVYLAVHFPADVYAGALLGVVSTALLLVGLAPVVDKKITQKGLLNT